MNQIFFGCTEPTEEQLTAAGIPFEVHIYEDGPHGLSIGTQACAQARSQIFPGVARWVESAQDWLENGLRCLCRRHFPWNCLGRGNSKRELKYGQQKRRKYDGTDSSAFGCMSLVPSVRMGIMGSSALHIRRKALSLR